MIDNGNLDATREVTASFHEVVHLRSLRNLGGAGGFCYGIFHALARNPEAIWLMDDDGYPEHADCLSGLHRAMVEGAYDMVSPLVLDVADATQLAFYYYRQGRPIKRRGELRPGERFELFAHLFNGALVRADAFVRFGMPRFELFFRGDEVDFMYRLKRGGARFCTITDVAFLHPSGARDTVPIMGGRYHAVVPASVATRHYFYRNRGNLYREFWLVRSICHDVLRYGWLFLITRRGDLAGLREWVEAVWMGWTRRFLPHGQNRGPSRAKRPNRRDP